MWNAAWFDFGSDRDPARSDRHRALHDDGLDLSVELVDHIGDVLGDPEHVLEVGGSIGVAGRADADEDRLRVAVGASLSVVNLVDRPPSCG